MFDKKKRRVTKNVKTLPVLESHANAYQVRQQRNHKRSCNKREMVKQHLKWKERFFSELHLGVECCSLDKVNWFFMYSGGVEHNCLKKKALSTKTLIYIWEKSHCPSALWCKYIVYIVCTKFSYIVKQMYLDSYILKVLLRC